MRDFIEGFYLLDPSENDNEAHKESGILFGNIFLSDPDDPDSKVTAPKIYFRYLQSNFEPSVDFPLEFNFTKTGDDIDYGFFKDENLAKFKSLYQHLSNMQIEYFIFVKLDSALFNGRTYKWKVH